MKQKVTEDTSRETIFLLDECKYPDLVLLLQICSTRPIKLKTMICVKMNSTNISLFHPNLQLPDSALPFSGTRKCQMDSSKTRRTHVKHTKLGKCMDNESEMSC